MGRSQRKKKKLKERVSALIKGKRGKNKEKLRNESEWVKKEKAKKKKDNDMIENESNERRKLIEWHPSLKKQQQNDAKNRSRYESRNEGNI